MMSNCWSINLNSSNFNLNNVECSFEGKLKLKFPSSLSNEQIMELKQSLINNIQQINIKPKLIGQKRNFTKYNDTHEEKNTDIVFNNNTNKRRKLNLHKQQTNKYSTNNKKSKRNEILNNEYSISEPHKSYQILQQICNQRMRKEENWRMLFFDTENNPNPYNINDRIAISSEKYNDEIKTGTVIELDNKYVTIKYDNTNEIEKINTDANDDLMLYIEDYMFISTIELAQKYNVKHLPIGTTVIFYQSKSMPYRSGEIAQDNNNGNYIIKVDPNDLSRTNKYEYKLYNVLEQNYRFRVSVLSIKWFDTTDKLYRKLEKPPCVLSDYNKYDIIKAIPYPKKKCIVIASYPTNALVLQGSVIPIYFKISNKIFNKLKLDYKNYELKLSIITTNIEDENSTNTWPIAVHRKISLKKNNELTENYYSLYDTIPLHISNCLNATLQIQLFDNNENEIESATSPKSFIIGNIDFMKKLESKEMISIKYNYHFGNNNRLDTDNLTVNDNLTLYNIIPKSVSYINDSILCVGCGLFSDKCSNNKSYSDIKCFYCTYWMHENCLGNNLDLNNGCPLCNPNSFSKLYLELGKKKKIKSNNPLVISTYIICQMLKSNGYSRKYKKTTDKKCSKKDINNNDYSKFTLNDLKFACLNLGVNYNGTKSQLKQRLEDSEYLNKTPIYVSKFISDKLLNEYIIDINNSIFLDLMCGTGNLIKCFPRNSKQIYGVEIDSNRANSCEINLKNILFKSKPIVYENDCFNDTLISEILYKNINCIISNPDFKHIIAALYLSSIVLQNNNNNINSNYLFFLLPSDYFTSTQTRKYLWLSKILKLKIIKEYKLGNIDYYSEDRNKAKSKARRNQDSIYVFTLLDSNDDNNSIIGWPVDMSFTYYN